MSCLLRVAGLAWINDVSGKREWAGLVHYPCRAPDHAQGATTVEVLLDSVSNSVTIHSADGNFYRQKGIINAPI